MFKIVLNLPFIKQDFCPQKCMVYRICINKGAIILELFADILRDADKIDILKVNVEVPLEEIYNVSTDDLMQAEVTKEVMQSFSEEHAILRALKRTPVDHVVGHISLVYELVYPISLKIVKEQDYLDKLMSFPSQNPKTLEQFEQLRGMMQDYINRSCHCS